MKILITLFVFSSLSVYSQNDALNYDKLLELQKEMHTLQIQFNDYLKVVEHNSEFNSMETVFDSYTLINYVFEPIKLVAYVQNFHFTKSEKKLFENYQKNIIERTLDSFELEKNRLNRYKSYISKEAMKINIDEAIIIIDKTIAELKR